MLKEADDFLQNAGLSEGSKTREQFTVAIRDKLKEVGSRVGNLRDKVYNLIETPEAKKSFILNYLKGLSQLKKEQTGIKGATINREFVNTVSKMEATLSSYLKQDKFGNYVNIHKFKAATLLSLIHI